MPMKAELQLSQSELLITVQGRNYSVHMRHIKRIAPPAGCRFLPLRKAGILGIVSLPEFDAPILDIPCLYSDMPPAYSFPDNLYGLAVLNPVHAVLPMDSLMLKEESGDKEMADAETEKNATCINMALLAEKLGRALSGVNYKGNDHSDTTEMT